VILVDIDHVRHNQSRRDYQHNNHKNGNSKFTHDSPPLQTGLPAYKAAFIYLDDKSLDNEDLLSSKPLIEPLVAPLPVSFR
jgi:hypothetical protein